MTVHLTYNFATILPQRVLYPPLKEEENMAFCRNCGAELPEGANNCTQCGAPTAGEQQAQQSNDGVQDFINNVTNTADFTTEYDPKDIQDNKVMAILSYIGFLFLIPLLAAPQSKFARFHVNQGMILFLLGYCVSAVFNILGAIPFIGILFSIIGWLFAVATLVFMILGIINASQGQAKELPVIGKIRLMK